MTPSPPATFFEMVASRLPECAHGSGGVCTKLITFPAASWRGGTGEKIATQIAAGLLGTAWYGPVRSRRTIVEIPDENAFSVTRWDNAYSLFSISRPVP
jgi:hypothetical protein